MKNVKNKSIFLALSLFIFITFILIPIRSANAFYYVGFQNGNYIGCETTLGTYGEFQGCGITNNNNNTIKNTYNNISNPIPSIYSISPNFRNINNNSVTTVTVNGSNFMPSSTIRFNSFDQPTTYINAETLKFQVSFSDVSNIGTFPITVANMGPGGGISNAISFNVNNNQTISSLIGSQAGGNTITKAKQTNAVAKSINTNTYSNSDITRSSLTGNALSANALFASDGFVPRTLLQWIIVFILILIIILLWRKLYYSDKNKLKPLKHA